MAAHHQNGSIREFVDGWTLGQTLGEGAFGEVKLLLNRQTGEAVAMKMVNLKKHPNAANSVKKEVFIQKILQDQHVLRFFGKRTQGDIEYIFLEYASGGELFDRIEPDSGMATHEAQRYFKQLLCGVRYLHEKGVAHRDLKPENLLLDEQDNIKISDFGMATMFRMKGVERLLENRCGTLPYVAPEVLVRPYYATPADLWSCGIVLVTMLAGELPWDQPTTACTEFIEWKANDRWTTKTPWKKLDTLALALLRKVLAIDPSERPLIDQLIEHKWCRQMSVPVVGHNSDGNSEPPIKRRCSPKQMAEVNLSQPIGSHGRYAEVGEDGHDTVDHCRPTVGFSFSQPTLLDDLLVCSQMNATQTTQASQNVFQKLVRRMTRFFVTLPYDAVLQRFTDTCDHFGYSWKELEDGLITITTIDRRKVQLIFKANLIEMDGKLLFDFRLSKGCGLEFKRCFVKIRKELRDIIMKGAVVWPTIMPTTAMAMATATTSPTTSSPVVLQATNGGEKLLE